MDYQNFIRQMAQTAESIRSLVKDISQDQARWRPDPESWSILEVVNHLYDEEREDFRVRLDILLHNPDSPWPPIDPQGWVASRNYNARDLAESLAGFLSERAQSIAWLESLVDPNMDSYIETGFRRMSGGDMFASWVAHDLLHIRQLVELRYAWIRRSLAPYAPDYAGEF